MSKEQLFRKCFEKAAGNAARGGQALTNDELGSLSDAFQNKVIEGRRKRLALTDAVLVARGTANTRKTSAMLEQYRTAQNILKIAELHGYVEANRGRHGSVPESIQRNIEDYQDEKSGTVSARGLALAINAESAPAMDRAVHYMGTKWYGLKDSAEKTFKLLQEMHGMDSGDAGAKAAAKGLTDRMEELLRNANRLGANIGKVAETYIPQAHAFWKVAEAGREAWTAHVMPLLDRSRYQDEITAEPWDNAKMTDFLHEAWWTLATQGTMKPEAGAKFGGIANRFSQERQIHFQRDPAAWLQYHQQFGTGETLLHMIEAKMHGMANQVSMLQKFGPSMQANINAVLNLEKARLGKLGDTTLADKFNKDKNGLDGSLGDMTMHKPIQNRKIQERFQSVRNVMAWRLGAATITAAPSDAATMMLVARANQASGLGAVVNTLRNIAKYNSESSRAQIQNAGLQAQALHQRFAETSGMMASSRITKYAADAIIKLGGLMQWTRAAREGFNLSLSNTIGHLVDRVDYASLNKEDARWLRQYGVDDKSFALWKAAQKQDWGHGEKLLTADAIRNVPDAAVQSAYAPEIAKGMQVVEDRKTVLNATIDERNARALKRSDEVKQREGGLADRLNRFVTKASEAMQAAIGKQQSAAYDTAMRAVNDKFKATTDKLTGLQQKVADYETSVREALAQKDSSIFKTALAKAQKKYAEVSELFGHVGGGDLLQPTEEGYRLITPELVSRTLERANKAEDVQARKVLSEQSAAKAAADAKLAGNQVSTDAVRKVIDDYQQFEHDKAKGLLGKFSDIEGKNVKAADKEMLKKYGELRTQVAEHWNDYLNWWDTQKQAIARTNDELEAIRQLAEGRAKQELDTYRTDAARHFLAVVHSESLGAVVEPRPNVQRMVKGAPGTLKGELWNTAMQFKSFPLATLGEHFWQRGIKAGRYGYVPAYLTAMLAAGVVSKVVADLIVGKEPAPFFNFEHPQALSKAWMQAFAKSGGLGIYGDLLLSDQQDASQAVVNAAAGPAVGDAVSILNAYMRARNANTPERAGSAALSQLINVGKNYVPGSSLWFARGIFNHAVVQNAQEMVNPGYLQRIQNTAERNQQPYFWAPGQAVPDSLPTLEHVAE